jgi:signal transduction histidine kinase
VSIDDDFLQIAIEDTGVGISKENQEKLFKLFGFLEET